MTFLDDLRAKSACSGGIAWAEANGITSVAEAWAKLTRPDWMFWLAEEFTLSLDNATLRQFAYECADRAVRAHAVSALRLAGLSAEADRLAALPRIVDAKTAEAAREAAWGAHRKILRRHSAADRDAARALWTAAEAVRDAAEAAHAAAWDAAWDATWDAAWAAAWVARGAAWDTAVDAAWAAADNKDIERLWQADRLRELFPEVTA